MTRRELIEKDEITTTLERATEFVYARKKEILIGVSAALVIAAGIIGWTIYTANRDANAQNQLGAAIGVFNDTTTYKVDKERYARALAESQKVFDAYRSLPSGQIAQYYMALSYEGLGDTKKAIENLEDVIRRGDSSVKGVAKYALAGIHKSHGETQKAIELYKQLLDGGGYSKVAVLFDLAKLHENLGQPAQAKENYQKIVAEFPESPFRQDADQALKDLGVSKP